MLKQNIIRVPEGCPTVHQAMDLAVIFSEKNECTRENPVKVVVGEGQHEMVGVLCMGDYGGTQTPVSCSNITIAGKGKGTTTILGGFYVNGKQNVNIEELSVTNPIGWGLGCTGSGTNVAITECSFKRCLYSGVYVFDGATATGTRCNFMENGQCGVVCDDDNTKVRLNDSTMHHNELDGLVADLGAVVDLHGTKTDIHSNKRHGIYNGGRVNIHLPSQHNTSHDNVGEDRVQDNGGSIANINADGTFTHVHVVVDDDADN